MATELAATDLLTESAMATNRNSKKSTGNRDVFGLGGDRKKSSPKTNSGDKTQPRGQQFDSPTAAKNNRSVDHSDSRKNKNFEQSTFGATFTASFSTPVSTSFTDTNAPSFQKVFRNVVEALQDSPTAGTLAESLPTTLTSDLETDGNLTALAELLAAGFLAQLPPLNQNQQTIIERLALLAADSGVDVPMLADLNAAELAKFADWLLADESELFADFPVIESALPAINTDNSALIDFSVIENNQNGATAGDLLKTVETAIAQFNELRQTVASAPIRDTALIGDLIKLSELPILAVDNLAQKIQELLPPNTDENLRALLAPLPSENLTAALNETLAQIAVDLPPEKFVPPLAENLPDIVVKSLAIEIIKTNHNDLAVAEKQLSLLDSLTRNADLRAALLRQVVDSEKLPDAVDETMLKNHLAQSELLTDLEIPIGKTDLIPESAVPLTNLETPEIADNLRAAEDVLPETNDVGTVIDQSVKDTDNDLEQRQNLPEQNNEDYRESYYESESGIADRTAEFGADENVTKPTKNVEQNSRTAEPVEIGVNSAANRNREPDDFEPSLKKTNGKNTAKNTMKIDNETLSAIEKNHSTATTDTDISISDSENFSPLRGIAISTDCSAPLNARLNDSESFSRQTILQENINRLAAMVEQNRPVGQTLKSLTLALNPPELGKVTVELQLSGTGGVSATVKTENDAARTLLLTGAENLRKTLEAKGVSLEQFNVELGGNDAEQRNSEQSAHNGGQWFDAMSDERDRRARHNANQLNSGERGKRNSEEAEVEKSEPLRIRAGSSFELIA